MGYEMSQSTPTAPNTAATDAKASTAAAQAQAAALTKRRGMASTIMTSPMGAGAAQTQKTTLG